MHDVVHHAAGAHSPLALDLRRPPVAELGSLRIQAIGPLLRSQRALLAGVALSLGAERAVGILTTLAEVGEAPSGHLYMAAGGLMAQIGSDPGVRAGGAIAAALARLITGIIERHGAAGAAAAKKRLEELHAAGPQGITDAQLDADDANSSRPSSTREARSAARPSIASM